MHRMSLAVLAVALACLQLGDASVRPTTRRPAPPTTARRAVTTRPPVRTTRARASTPRRSVGSSSSAGPCAHAQNGTWFDGCNWCTCATDGGPMACSYKYCQDNYRTIAGCPSGKAPGDTWFENCNSFSCQRSSDGTLTTTGTVNGQCWPGSSRATPAPAGRPGATGGSGVTTAGPCVAANSTWYDGCNTCRCIRGEPTACTRRACQDHIRTIAGCPSGVAPGHSWYANCNRYKCVRANNTIVTQHTTGGNCW